MTITNLLQALVDGAPNWLLKFSMPNNKGLKTFGSFLTFEQAFKVIHKAFERPLKGFYKAFRRPLKACKIPFNSPLRPGRKLPREL